MLNNPAAVTVESFGYAQPDGAAEGQLVIDVRSHFRDPHVNQALRYLTGRDPEVVAAVLATPGIPALIDSVVAAVAAFGAGPTPGPLKVSVGCVGGRHRSVVVAAEVARRIGPSATVTHRDIDRLVIERGATVDQVTPEPFPEWLRIACGFGPSPDR